MRSINKVILLGRLTFPPEDDVTKAEGYLRFDMSVFRPTADGRDVINTIPCLASGRLSEVIKQHGSYGAATPVSVYLEGHLRPFGAGMIVSVDTVQLLGKQG